ncbi:MAG: hypothetical protein GY950_13625 [bacterium]|nr:hypothetical protein [bacterium]
MKNKIIGMLLVFAAVFLFLSGSIRAVEQDREPLSVLFIGNSFTFYHDLPELTAALANSVNKTTVLTVDSVTIGGATLQQLWESGKALERIKTKKWNYVVLQENGGIAMRESGLLCEYAQKFAKEIKNSGAKTLFYITPAYRDRPQKQPAINRTYFNCAERIMAGIVPVGQAWARAAKEKPGLVLHNEDKVHSNLTGAYLTACVFYAVLFDKSPTSLPASIEWRGKMRRLVDPQDAIFLAKIAGQVVREPKK